MSSYILNSKIYILVYILSNINDIELPGTLQIPSRIARLLYPILKYKLNLLIDKRRPAMITVRREIARYDLLIAKKKVEVYGNIKEIKIGERTGEKALKKVKNELANLIDKLIRIEKLEKSLERKRKHLKMSELTKHVKNELKEIHIAERKLELQKEHIEKILRDAKQHLREREEKAKHLEKHYAELEHIVKI